MYAFLQSMSDAIFKNS